MIYFTYAFLPEAYNKVMNTTIKVLLVAGIVLLAAAAIAFVLMQKDSTNNVDTAGEAKLTEMKLSYVLSEETKNLYGVTVAAGTDKQEGYVVVHGKACNVMNSTIQILQKGETTDKTVIKTLSDGRQVVKPMTVSTMMACVDTKPEHDDKALDAAIETLASSIQSY